MLHLWPFLFFLLIFKAWERQRLPGGGCRWTPPILQLSFTQKGFFYNPSASLCVSQGEVLANRSIAELSSRLKKRVAPRMRMELAVLCLQGHGGDVDSLWAVPEASCVVLFFHRVTLIPHSFFTGVTFQVPGRTDSAPLNMRPRPRKVWSAS